MADYSVPTKRRTTPYVAPAQQPQTVPQRFNSALMGAIQRYGGPHLGGALLGTEAGNGQPARGGLLSGAAELSPGADVRDMMQGSGQLMQGLANADPFETALGGGLMGAATLGMAIPGSVGGYRQAAEEIAEELDLEKLLRETRDIETPKASKVEGRLDAFPAAIPPEYEFSNFEDIGGQIVEMSPDEFLGLSSHLPVDAEVRDNVNDLAQMMLEGRKIDPPRLSVGGSGVVDSHDGRHRALAAMQLGIDRVPVLLMGEGGQSFPEGVTKLRSQLGASSDSIIDILRKYGIAGVLGGGAGAAAMSAPDQAQAQPVNPVGELMKRQR